MTAQTYAQMNNITRNTHTLLGEVIAWNLPDNTTIPYTDLLDALRAAGLNEKVAKEMLPRYAFVRAAKELADQRIIRQVADEGGVLTFQFTREYLDKQDNQFHYQYETALDLDKTTGKITPHDPADRFQTSVDTLITRAQALLEKCKNERLTGDITRYLKILFNKEADLFPVRNAGGVYFVPEQHMAFVDKIETLVTTLHGNVTRFPVPVGTKAGDKSVQQAVSQGLQQLIDEHLMAVDQFGTDTRVSTIERHVNKIEQTKFKIEAYAGYLADQQEKLLTSLKTVSLTVRQKLEQVLAAQATADGDNA